MRTDRYMFFAQAIASKHLTRQLQYGFDATKNIIKLKCLSNLTTINKTYISTFVRPTETEVRKLDLLVMRSVKSTIC
jgi:hypothetical protein